MAAMFPSLASCLPCSIGAMALFNPMANLMINLNSEDKKNLQIIVLLIK